MEVDNFNESTNVSTDNSIGSIDSISNNETIENSKDISNFDKLSAILERTKQDIPEKNKSNQNNNNSVINGVKKKQANKSKIKVQSTDNQDNQGNQGNQDKKSYKYSNKKPSVFSRSFLMSGNDFELTPKITLYHPIVEDIQKLNKGFDNERLYWEYVSMIMSDPYSNMVLLDDMGLNYLETTPYEVFVIQWDNVQNNYLENQEMYDKLNYNPLSVIINALRFFISGDHIFMKSMDENGEICFVDYNDKECKITKEIYEYIYDWVKSINRIDYSDRINPADENARKILIEDMRDEIKKRNKRKNKKKETNDYIGSQIEAVCFGGNGGITPFNQGDTKLYWLFSAFKVDMKKTNTAHILDGVYHGTIKYRDVKKSELEWYN